MFQNIAILGVGLIGASMGLDFKRKKMGHDIVGFGRSRANLRVAQRRGAIDRVAPSLEEAVFDADLIVLAGPVSAARDQLQTIAQFAKPGALVMDVGSTKQDIVHAAAKILPQHVFFIGAHPMAGTENSGAAAALHDLFKGRSCVLTPVPGTPARALSQVKKLWQKLGSKTLVVSPEIHDTILSMTSHLPQVVASALMQTVAREVALEGQKKFSGGGLRDTTRIAASPPEMWRDICLSNRPQLLRALNLFQRELSKITKLIAKQEGKKIFHYFDVARAARRKLS